MFVFCVFGGKLMSKTLSGTLFKKMVTNGAINLKNNHHEINLLNVFPVPDGDTGTNMHMTIMAGVNEILNSQSKSIVDVSKILSRGCLMGARGNSGVILSQFFRGVYSEIAQSKNGSATVDEFIASLVAGSQMAYKAVMTPVEGTILTVVREAADAVLRKRNEIETIEDVLTIYLDQANETLENTPELLPVLKEAGVVDSGGAGFIKIIEGMLLAIQGDMISADAEIPIHAVSSPEPMIHDIETADIKFGYCTEFIVKLEDQGNFNSENLKNILNNMGDSLVLVQDDELLKVHIHTNQPGVVLTLGQKYGELQTMKIDNMRLQYSDILDSFTNENMHSELVEEPSSEYFQSVNYTRQKFSVIAVASGVGIKHAFKELGVDYIVDGGQTMNPPTEDFVKAIKAVNADNVIILPNNKNIILTAEQTLDICENTNIRVLQTKSIAQGYAAMMVFDNNNSLDDNVEAMCEVSDSVKMGELTYSIRDTELNGVKIKKGDYIGITDGDIAVSTAERFEGIKQLADQVICDECEIVTVFYGKEVPLEEALALKDYIEKSNPDLEVELIDGQQDVYDYIISAE
ncbi:MAG: DAK2 domain-containing protein [Acholeplasmataceae bacterium]|nr:DAK2 domain-containing protein [Acholeplasmataceae bacterium]